MRTICFDFIQKGGLACRSFVASAHDIGIALFIEEFNSIFELFEDF